MSLRIFSLTAIVIIWLTMTIRVSSAAPPQDNNELHGSKLNITQHYPIHMHHTTSVPYEPGSKPPLVQMATWHKTKRETSCEDTENPCVCCCINCWEYLDVETDDVDRCYGQCNSHYRNCDCTRKRSPDYVNWA